MAEILVYLNKGVMHREITELREELRKKTIRQYTQYVRHVLTHLKRLSSFTVPLNKI